MSRGQLTNLDGLIKQVLSERRPLEMDAGAPKQRSDQQSGAQSENLVPLDHSLISKLIEDPALANNMQESLFAAENAGETMGHLSSPAEGPAYKSSGSSLDDQGARGRIAKELKIGKPGDYYPDWW